MIKIHPVVRDIVLSDMEAYTALTSDYMNMSSYAYKIRPKVEALTKKKTTITSLVVSLSRLKKEFKKEKPLIRKIHIKNITTKLPLSEIVFENNSTTIKKLEGLHNKISVGQEDFFTTTIGTSEINIITSSGMEGKILKHFGVEPKYVNHNFAAVGVSLGTETFNIPNVFFSLFAILAKAYINIEEIVSTSTELIFIVTEKDFAKTVSLFLESKN